MQVRQEGPAESASASGDTVITPASESSTTSGIGTYVNGLGKIKLRGM